MEQTQTPTLVQFIGLGNTLWVIFAVVLFVTALSTLAFYYHWGKYAPSHFGAIATIVVYTTGVGLLLIAMLSVLSII